MNFIKKIIKKNVNEVLKEEQVYTIKRDDLCYIRTSVLKTEAELNTMQMVINSIRDKIINGEDVDYRLLCLQCDLSVAEARMKDFSTLLPNPYKEHPREV